MIRDNLKTITSIAVLFTALLTSALMAQQTFTRKALPVGVKSQPEIKLPQISLSTSSGDDLRKAALASADPVKQQVAMQSLVSYRSLDLLQATFNGTFLDIAANVTLYDTRPNYRYRWTLNVYHKKTGRKLVARIYDDQVFTLPLGEIQTPSFQDRVRMKPDTYDVELIVHSVRADVDSAVLSDPQAEQRYRVLTGRVIVKP